MWFSSLKTVQFNNFFFCLLSINPRVTFKENSTMVNNPFPKIKTWILNPFFPGGSTWHPPFFWARKLSDFSNSLKAKSWAFIPTAYSLSPQRFGQLITKATRLQNFCKEMLHRRDAFKGNLHIFSFSWIHI